MSKTIQQMSAQEYKLWMESNPEEAKKLDEPSTAPIVPVTLWRNGVLVTIEPGQNVKNGAIQ